MNFRRFLIFGILFIGFICNINIIAMEVFRPSGVPFISLAPPTTDRDLDSVKIKKLISLIHQNYNKNSEYYKILDRLYSAMDSINKDLYTKKILINLLKQIYNNIESPDDYKDEILVSFAIIKIILSIHLR